MTISQRIMAPMGSFTILALLFTITTAVAQEEPAAPKITLAPKNQKVGDDMLVSFFCKATGHPPPTFHWEKEGKKLNSKRNYRYFIHKMPHGSVLRIEPVKARKVGSDFTCVAENEYGRAEANVTLTIYPTSDIPPGFPMITQDPVLKSIEKDHTATLTCQASAVGLPNPPYMYWLKESIPVDLSDPRISILEGGSLVIEKSQESDMGKYECVAENEVGVSYSSAAMLYVKVRRVPPHFSIPPEDIEVDPGADVNITCVAVGSPMPLVKWREGAKDLTPEDELPVGRNILTLTKVRESKNYTCVASSDLGNIEHDVQVKVKALPNPPVKLRASEITAASLKLTWEPGGMGPVLSYSILYKPKHVTGDYTKIFNIRHTEYTIDQLQAYTQYEFRVLASNNLGDGVPSSPIEVVTGELAPGSAPRNVYAVPVSPQTIMVHWEEPEIPNGVIQGYKIFYTLKPDLSIVLWDTQDVNSGIKTTTIINLEPNRTYTLSMLAFSNMGQGPLSETIQVMTTQGVPLQPRNLQATAVSPNEIEIAWDAPQDANKIIGYILYYNDSKQRLHGEITINPPSTKFKLTDLIPDTVYHFQLSARSATGEGVRTPTIQLKTPQFVPSAPPQAVSGKPISSRSIEVTWKPPPPDQQNGRIIGYKILFVENSTRSTEKDAKVEDVASEARSVMLHSLSTWTAYKIWVLAYTSVGDGSLSHPIVVRTEEDVTGKPKRVKVEAVNSTTIFVEWHPPQAQERNGIIRGYYVYYVEVDTNDDPIPSTEKRIDTEDGNKMDVVIVNLKPDTRYHVQVAGYTHRGDGIRSKSMTVTTKGAVPSAPRNLQAELIQAEPPQVQVSWHRPEEIHGNLEGYKLYWGRIGQLYRQIILQANQQSYIATLLDRGATYEFRVLARNQVDYGERAVTTIDTPDGRFVLSTGLVEKPPTPDNVKVQRTSPTTIQVSWDEPPPNSDIESYRVYYNNLIVADMSIWKTIDTDGPSTVTQITNLDVKTSYAIRVQAKSVNGCWSNISQAVVTDFMPKERPEMVQNFQATGKSSRQLTLSWDPPRKKNVNNYLLKYMGTKSYRENGFPQSYNAPLQEVKIPGQLETHPVRNLVPKMKYEFNISAIFQDGTMGEETQLIVETRIEAPQKVETPKIQKITGGKITLRLSAASEMFGPLSHYEVIVVHKENTTKLPKDFTQEELTKEQTPVTFPAMQPYIAAKFTPKGFPSEFTLGTGGQVGGYYNRPLDPDRIYRVFLRAYTVKTTLYKSSDYSDLFHPQGKIVPMPSYPPNVLPPDTSQDPVPVTDGDKNHLCTALCREILERVSALCFPEMTESIVLWTLQNLTKALSSDLCLKRDKLLC